MKTLKSKEMKNGLAIVFIILCMGCSVRVNDQQRVKYSMVVSKLIESCRQNSGSVFAFPELIDYYESILKNDICKFTVQTIRTTSNNDRIVNLSVLYFDNGKIFFKSDPTDLSGINYITKDDGVYSWKNGNDEGVVYRNNIDDQTALLLYLLDPSAIMKSLYKSYISNNKDSNISFNKIKDTVVIMNYNNDGTTMTAVVSLKPIWFTSLKIIRPLVDVKVESVYQQEYSLPIIEKSIPANFLSVPEKIKWIQSNDTVSKVMSWL